MLNLLHLRYAVFLDYLECAHSIVFFVECFAYTAEVANAYLLFHLKV